MDVQGDRRLPRDRPGEFLIENTNGAVVIGTVSSAGQTNYAQVGGLGSEWNFVGTGDYLGDGKDQFLIENTNGAVVVGEIGANEPGDLHPGRRARAGMEVRRHRRLPGRRQGPVPDRERHGAVVLGEVGANDQTTYTQVANLGPNWQFVGTGDYDGSGHASFLIENANGAVVSGTVENGQAHYAQVGALGSEWAFHE